RRARAWAGPAVVAVGGFVAALFELPFAVVPDLAVDPRAPEAAQVPARVAFRADRRAPDHDVLVQRRVVHLHLDDGAAGDAVQPRLAAIEHARDLGVECVGEGVEHGRLGLAETLHGAVVNDVGIEEECAHVENLRCEESRLFRMSPSFARGGLPYQVAAIVRVRSTPISRVRARWALRRRAVLRVPVGSVPHRMTEHRAPARGGPAPELHPVARTGGAVSARCDSSRNAWTSRTALQPPPTAAATRFTDPNRTSPTAKMPGRFVSSRYGGRASGHLAAASSAAVRSPPVFTNPVGSSAMQPVVWAHVVLGSAPQKRKTCAIGCSSIASRCRQRTCSSSSLPMSSTSSVSVCKVMLRVAWMRWTR